MTTLLLGFLLMAVRNSFPPILRPALGLWLRGNLLQPVGFVLYAMRDHASPFVTIVVANLVIVAAFCDYQSAIYRLLERREPRGGRWILLGIVLVAVLVFTYAVDAIAWRIVIISLVLAAIAALSALPLLAGPWRTLSPARRVTGLVFVFGVFVLFLRIGNTLANPENITNGLESTIGQVALFSTAALLPLLGSYGFLLLCTDRMREELERVATTDYLTGLLNRRAIQAEGRAAVNDARSRGSRCAVLMLNIDHFKRINDERGHAGGDEALAEVVARVAGAVREPHVLGRFGGEEFLLLLPHGEVSRAAAVAETLRAAVADAPLQLASGDWPGTVSVGVAVLAGHDRDFDDLVRRADAALYRAKDAGRNRVEVALSSL